MATLTNVAVRELVATNGVITERTKWLDYSYTEDVYCGYRSSTVKSTVQFRAYLSEPCTSITLKVTPFDYASTPSTSKYYFKASTNEQDSVLELGAVNVTTTSYDVVNTANKYNYSTVTVTINGNFPAGYIYIYAWANNTNKWLIGNDDYPTKIMSATSATAYSLTLSQGANSTIGVSRTSGLGATGTLASGAKIYSGDVLKITFSAATGYNVGTHTVNGSTFTSGNTHTVSGNVTVVSSATKKTYTVTYNANGGTGAPAAQTKTHGTTLTLSSTKPTRAAATTATYTVTYNANGGTCSTASATAKKTTSYTFKNWNTASGGTGTSYAAGGSYTTDTAVTLYAQWNSSTSTASVALPTPTRVGFTFKGWATSSSATSGSTGNYTPSANVTLYATWSANSITFNYYSNNGTQTKFVSWTASASTSYPNNHWNYTTGTYKQTYTGYTGTGYFGTTPEGGTLAGEDEQFASYAALCERYGVSTTTVSTTIDIYAQWKPVGAIYLDNGTSVDAYHLYGDNGTSIDLYLFYMDNGTSVDICG